MHVLGWLKRVTQPISAINRVPRKGILIAQQPYIVGINLICVLAEGKSPAVCPLQSLILTRVLGWLKRLTQPVIPYCRAI